MMPDLGQYAAAVIWSYIASFALIAALVALSIWQGRRTLRALAEIEARAKTAPPPEKPAAKLAAKPTAKPAANPAAVVGASGGPQA